jgi:hypothetical protein
MAKVIPAIMPKTGHPTDDATNRTATEPAVEALIPVANEATVAARCAVSIVETAACDATRTYPVVEEDT